MLVLVGLTVVIAIFFWPTFISSLSISLRIPLLAVHIFLLILYDPYLYIHRKILIPIRYALMPLVIEIAKSEAIKEETDTWYVSTQDLPRTNDSNVLLRSFPKRVRREIKRKLKKYQNRGIKTVTKHSDHLSLYKDMPVLIDAQRKAVRGTNKSFAGEFVKRFLVIFLTTSGYIDRYYTHTHTHDDSRDGDDNDDHNEVDEDGPSHNENMPVAISLFVGQGKVLHTFMYFCEEKENDSGIWFYQHFRMIQRAAASVSVSASALTHVFDDTLPFEEAENESPLLPARDNSSEREYLYVNFHVHQDFAKKCIGAKPASFNDRGLLDQLYPFTWFHEVPKPMIDTELNIENILAGSK